VVVLAGCSAEEAADCDLETIARQMAGDVEQECGELAAGAAEVVSCVQSALQDGSSFVVFVSQDDGTRRAWLASDHETSHELIEPGPMSEEAGKVLKFDCDHLTYHPEYADAVPSCQPLSGGSYLTQVCSN